MKKYLLFFFLIVCIFGISGCKKTELTGSLSIYAGNWEGTNAAHLQLNEDGTAAYYYYDGVTKTIEGRLLIKDSTLKIKNKKLKIDMLPTILTDPFYGPSTYMTLGGVRYIKR